MTVPKAYIYTALSILLWSTVASAFKLTLREIDYLQLLFYASAASAVSLFIVLLAGGKIRLLKAQSAGEIAQSAGMGLINPALYYLVLFRAYSLMPAQEAQPLNWTWPVVLALFSALFLRQKLTLKKLLGVLISFGGVIIISTRGRPFSLDFSQPEGVALAVGSSVIWASFWVLNLRDKRDPVLKLFMCFGFGVVYNFVAVLLFSDFRLGSLAGALGAVYVGLFEMGVTFIFWLKALDLSRDSAKIGNLAYVTPFLSLIFIYFVVGETILLSSVGGLALIVGGILVGILGKRRGRLQP